jgi:pimeloyl-ACP methyl ester carboxylesterase
LPSDISNPEFRFTEKAVTMKKIGILVVCLILAVAGAYYAFPEQVAGYLVGAARNKAGLTKKEIQIGDHTIVYLEGGQGPTILLLHGYAGNKDNWIRLAPYLTKDYHVVIPDIPGYGESAKLIKASYDLSSQLSRIHQFAQTLKLKHFHVAGNSMGGFFAGMYAVRFPEDIQSLGLFNAGGVQEPQEGLVRKMRGKGVNLLVLKDSDDLSRLMTLLFVNPPSLPYPFKKMMVRTALANRPFYEKELKELLPEALSLEKDLSAITAPALILWGDQDKVIDVSCVPVFEKGLRKHQTVIIKDCGHLPMLEKPAETAAAYIGFLKSIASKGGNL